MRANGFSDLDILHIVEVVSYYAYANRIADGLGIPLEDWIPGLSFRYFAYGSNVWVPRMVSRCPSATVSGVAHLDGWRAVYDKPSVDGSSKLNVRPAKRERVHGVVYEIGR